MNLANILFDPINPLGISYLNHSSHEIHISILYLPIIM